MHVIRRYPEYFTRERDDRARIVAQMQFALESIADAIEEWHIDVPFADQRIDELSKC